MAIMPLRGNAAGAKMLWLLLMMLPLIWANSSADRKGSLAGTTVAPHRNPHQQQRLLQLQEAQQLEASAHQQHHHHLRHEQHLRAELEMEGGGGNHQPPIEAPKKPFESQLPMQQHHLRHHNRHHLSWEQRVFPAMRHQQHHLASTPRNIFTTDAPITTTTAHPHPHPHALAMNHSRIFDRDSIWPAWAEPRSTRAPNWRQEVDSSSSNGESDEDSDAEDEDEDEDEDYEDEDNSNGVDEEFPRKINRYSLFSQQRAHLEGTDKDAELLDTNYDQSDELDLAAHRNRNSNKHPSVANPHDKNAGKRDLFDWLFKRDKQEKQEKIGAKKPPTGSTASPTTTSATTTTKRPMLRTRTEKPKLELIDANLQRSDLDEDYSNEDSDSESEEGFSNEQWNKIEHEHHLKQQKHQKELQALREKNRNTPLIRNVASPPVAYNSETEDVDNIYSRNYITGSLTRKKEEQLGTPEATLKARRLQAQKNKHERELASAHLNQVLKESTCRVPQKRCQQVQQDPSKIYSPHCTILHRCSEDSGCCPSRTQICAAKSTHNVELHFFVKSSRHRSVIEKRTFVNHTECHCIERSNYDEETAMAMTSAVRATILSCTCPRSFEKILQDDGQCRCDCSSGNNNCDWLKGGNEHFAMNDRKCIQQGRCKPPTCEFGQYMEKHGRCPKQHEQPVYNAMS